MCARPLPGTRRAAPASALSSCALRVELAGVERHPQQFAAVLEDIHRVRLQRFPYSVYYVVLPDGISVLAVMHDRRHPRRWHARR